MLAAINENPIKPPRCHASASYARLAASRDDVLDKTKNINNAYKPARPTNSKMSNAVRYSSPLCKYSVTQLLLVRLSIVMFIMWINGSVAAGDTQQQHQMQQRTIKVKRPDSSSSMFAEVENLNDSSIKTRMGRINIEHLGDSPNDFDRLVEKMIAGEPEKSNIDTSGAHNQAIIDSQLKQFNQQQQQQSQVSADANNKTTMRFFRNNRTFASIVYTNPIQDNQRHPRRLINCHLVDLERHSSDVALYEAKYDIQTIDVEFKDMMQLIEACTNIARLRRRPNNGTQQQQLQQPGVLFAAPHGPGGGAAGNNNNNNSGLKPTIVVGRPVATIANQPNQAQSLTSFHQVMSGALNQELKQLGPTIDDSNLLDLPKSSSALSQARTFTEMHNHREYVNVKDDNNHRHSNHQHTKRNYPNNRSSSSRHKKRRYDETRMEQQAQQQRQPTTSLNYSVFDDELLNKYQKKAMKKYESTMKKIKRQLNSMPIVKTINKVSEASKKLVLGEVTVPPEIVSRSGSGSGGGVREAIQEISSYDTSDLLSIWRGILPGTNWCGMGDRATSYNDLGFESDIDICCRAHDFCPIRLSAFSSGYGLFNWSFYTRSHCWCDQNFLDCLQQAESPLSMVVMKFYFTIMKTTCLNDNETANALEQLDSVGIRPLLGLGQRQQKGPPITVTALTPPSQNHRSGSSFLRTLEQQASAALGIRATNGGNQQQQQQSKQQSPQQQPPQQQTLLPNQYAIPALQRSRELQSRLDERKQQQQPN